MRVAQEQQVPMISLISTKGSTGKIVDDDVICQRDDTLSSARGFKFKNCCHLFVRYGFINVRRGKATAVILCNTILNDVRGYRKSVASFSLFWASYNEGNECKRNHFSFVKNEWRS